MSGSVYSMKKLSGIGLNLKIKYFFVENSSLITSVFNVLI